MFMVYGVSIWRGKPLVGLFIVSPWTDLVKPGLLHVIKETVGNCVL